MTVKGKDIKNLGLPPSPLYGELMDNVFEAKINGIIATRDEEIAFLKKLIEKLKKIFLTWHIFYEPLHFL